MRELIKSVESNSRKYQQFLRKVDRPDSPQVIEKSSDKIMDLLYTITNIQDEVIEFRLKKILSEEHPYIPRINVKKIQPRELPKKNAVSNIVDTFLKQRKILLNLIISLPENMWERTGVLEDEGHVTFKEFVIRVIKKDTQILTRLNHLLLSFSSYKN